MLSVPGEPLVKRSPKIGEEDWFRKLYEGRRDEPLESGMPGKGKPSLAAASLSASEMVTLMKLGFFRSAFLDALLVEGAGSRVPRTRSALDPGSVNGELS